MGRSGSISVALGTSLAGLLCGWGTAAPPPVLPMREAGCRGVPAGAVGPLVVEEAVRPAEVVPGVEVPLTLKYLGPISSDPGNKLTLPHSACLLVPWNAIPRLISTGPLEGLGSVRSGSN